MKGKHNHTLTEGSITPAIIRFALPFILGNLLQQCYNITDTFIVGRILGPEALAAVGSSYALMIFVTSISLVYVWEAVLSSLCSMVAGNITK